MSIVRFTMRLHKTLLGGADEAKKKVVGDKTQLMKAGACVVEGGTSLVSRASSKGTDSSISVGSVIAI